MPRPSTTTSATSAKTGARSKSWPSWQTETETPAETEDVSTNPYEPKLGEDGRGKIKLFDHQIEAMDSRERICALVGGTGSGKTWLGPHKILKRIRERPGSRSMAIGMQYERHVVNVMQKSLLDFCEAFHLNYKLVTGRRITFPQFKNSEILFGSAEKPESLEGPHLDGMVWMDEAGYMARFAYEVARRRTGYHAGIGTQVYISTIPYIPGWLKHEVYEPAMKGEKTIRWIKCRSIDNPNYDFDEIAYHKSIWRPEKFATIYLGEFARPHGMIYREPEADSELLFSFNDFPGGSIPEDWPCFAGHDWGTNNPTTGVWGRLDPETDILYLVAEYEVRGMTAEMHLGEWRSLGLDAVDLAFGDPADPDAIISLSSKGYNLVKGNNAINYGIDVVDDRFRTWTMDRWGRPSRRIRFAEGLNTLLDYRASYVWDKDKNDDEVLLDKPAKPQPAEHLMDALRYLCVGIVEEGLSSGPPEIGVGGRELGRVA